MPNEINAYSWSSDVDLVSFFFQIMIACALSMFLRWHFRKFGSVLSNRDDLGQVLPIICTTIVLIITVVKSSLALSLGLVGALSIVRFRTPIKEPEELAYLFIAIAVGLGLGAGQTRTTILAFVVVMLVTTLIKWHKRFVNTKNLYLSLNWQKDRKKESKGNEIERINEIISSHTKMMNIRRVDVQNDFSEINYVVDLRHANSLDLLIDDLKKDFSDMQITFLDQNNMPSL